MSWDITVKIPADEFWGDLEGEAMEGVDVVVGRAGDAMVARIKQILLSGGSGPPGPEGAPPRSGEATREVAASIKRTPVVRSGRSVFTKVYAEDERAPHLEFGHVEPDKKTGLKSGAGHTGRHARPHPFFRPAFEELGEIIARRFHEHFG